MHYCFSEDVIDSIVGLLNELEDSVDKCHKRAFDTRYESLELWNAYELFINKVLYQYPPSTNKEIQKERNLAIFELLRFDEMTVSAKGSFEQEKDKLFKYIDELKDALKGGVKNVLNP